MARVWEILTVCTWGDLDARGIQAAKEAFVWAVAQALTYGGVTVCQHMTSIEPVGLLYEDL